MYSLIKIETTVVICAGTAVFGCGIHFSAFCRLVTYLLVFFLIEANLKVFKKIRLVEN